MILLFSSFLFANANEELLLAISQKNFDAVQKAIEKRGASVSYRDSNKRTPLHWAVISGDLKIVAYLIYKGASLTDREKNGAQPLHLVAYSKNLDIVKYLIQKGADINAVDYAGWTPLHYYTYYQFELGVKYLIYANADLSLKTTKSAMGIPAGFTALDIASKIGKQAYIDALSNPQNYQNLANRPVLSLVALQPSLSFSNILLAEEKGTLTLFVSNTGQAAAESTIIEWSGFTNPWVAISTNSSPKTIWKDSMASWSFDVVSLSPPHDTTASFLVRAVDAASGSSSPWQEVTFSLWSQRPPFLLLGFTLLGDTNLLIPSMQAHLKLWISNEGLGPLQDATLTIQDNRGWIEPMSIPLVTLPRQSLTNIELSFLTRDTMQNGSTTLEFILNSSRLSKPIVFSKELPTRGPLPPHLVIKPSLYKKLSPIITTNTVMLENGETNFIFTTNSILLSYPMIEVLNDGESRATNLTITVNITTLSNLISYTYTISQLASFEKRSLAIPIELTSLQDTTATLKINDLTTTLLETNLIFHDWPKE